MKEEYKIFIFAVIKSLMNILMIIAYCTKIINAKINVNKTKCCRQNVR